MIPRRNKDGELGQGLVEFAVIFPLFIFMVAIIFDIGLGFNRQATMQHAVREGARYAALRDNSDGGTFVKQRTSDQAQGLVDPDDVTICFDDIDGNGVGAGDAVDVTVIYEYSPIFLRTIDGLFGQDIAAFDMEVTGSARLERDIVGGPSC